MPIDALLHINLLHESFMSLIKQYLQTLRPATQKLVCLYAYIGHDLKDDDRLQLSVHGECLMGELPLMTQELIKEGFVVHEAATHFNPQRQYIRPRMYGEVMRFGIEEHPEWFQDFDTWPLTRYPEFDELQKAVRRCGEGKRPRPMVLNSALPPYLISLADERRYEPLLPMIRDVNFPAFISALSRKWIKEDFVDEEEIIKRQLNLRRFDSTDPEIKEMKSLVNYYNYVCMGEYTPPTSIRMTYADFLLKGVHAMAQGKSDLALKVFAEAQNALVAKSKNKEKTEAYIIDPVASFYWVVAVWTSKPKAEAVKLLADFADEVRKTEFYRVGAAVLLADTLSHPLQRVDVELLTKLINPERLSDREYVLQQRMTCLLAANFTGFELTTDNFQPHSAFLRHEAERYITFNKFEKKRLNNAFGKEPTSALTKTVDPWEIMLDRLIASEQQHEKGADEGEHRVMYTIMSDGESVEMREQNRLRDGRWGTGKQLAWNRFISGTEPFMDRDDQAIVADLRFLGATRLTVGVLLPHLVGSDRVYTGEKTPYRRVTIEEQKPYIILEPSENGGFHLQSNVLFKDLLSQSAVYRRDDAMHYTYFPMGDHERAVLQQLLSVTDFPPEAEEKLRELLPLITRTTDIHSSLLPIEEEVTDSEAQTSLILRLTPDPTSQTMFDAYILIRPLVGGKMVLMPAKGDRVIIDYSEKTGRVRLERNIEAEKANLNLLLPYCLEHMIEFSASLNAHVSTPQALDLLAFASAHQDICSVEWPEGEKLKMRTAQKGDWNISLTSHGRWFEIEGNVHLDDDSLLTAQQLLEAVGASHGGYVQLQSGDYLWLSQRLRKQLDAIESLTTIENNKPVISALQSNLLADLVNGELEISHDDFSELKERFERAEKANPTVPEALHATLRPYQIEGYKWLTRLSTIEAGACLADDMGLGKTVQTIAFLLSRAHEGPALVVAPASVVPNWRSEIARFAPSLTVYNLNEYFDRLSIIQNAKGGDVIIVTYGLLAPSQQDITSREWNIICLDEAHNIKNRGTKTSQICMAMSARHRLILTGTPVQNHLGELWNLFQFINPGLLGSYEQFHQKYIVPIENMQDQERRQQLQALVSPFMLRRTKQAVAKDLPDKTEINISVELTDDEMAFYEVIRREAEQKVRDGGNQVTINALSELTRLRRTACSPELTNASWYEGSSKVNTFLELVQNIVESGNSVLVFSQFTSFLAIISRALKEAHLPHIYLDGSLSMKQREALVNDFQKGKSPIFLISLKAGGVGLNLTAANYVIHLDPWWNPAIEQQATDRAYRIGQTKAVTVYHLISHHTIEEKILRLHESKRALSDGVLEGSENNYKITPKDMLEMLSDNW